MVLENLSNQFNWMISNSSHYEHGYWIFVTVIKLLIEIILKYSHWYYEFHSMETISLFNQI